MNTYQFVDKKGTFQLKNPEMSSYLYFPIAGEDQNGAPSLKGAVTPALGGDLKTDQNHFILQPVSVEELHNNHSTRNFWCVFEDGTLLSATGESDWQKAARFDKDADESLLEAGVLWHKITRNLKEKQLEASVLSFVPVIENSAEVMYVEIENKGSEEITFCPVAAIPLYGRSADNVRDHRHVTSLLHRAKTTASGVVVKPTLSFDERGHQTNHTAYFVLGSTDNGSRPEAFFPVTEDFIGEGGSYTNPGALRQNLPGEKSFEEFDGFETLGGICYEKVTLAPGEKKGFIQLTGCLELAEGEEFDENRYLAALNTADKVKAALAATNKYWEKKQNIIFKTGDTDFNNFMYWVSFQPVLRRIYGCSFLPHHDYGKGGRGWRDLWQDCLALLLMNPAGVKDMLYSYYGGIRMDGTNATIIGTAPGEFIADRNNITRVWCDHGLWPLITTGMFLDMTGDYSLLLKENTYFKDKQVCRGTQTDTIWSQVEGTCQRDAKGLIYKGTVLEHLLLQNLTAFYDVGDHNHLKLRGADWNDALDMAPDKGESVAFHAAYAGNLESLANILSGLAKKGTKELEILEEMELLFCDDAEVYGSPEKKQALLFDYCSQVSNRVKGEKKHISVEVIEKSLRSKAEWIREHIRSNEWIDADDCGWFNSYYDNHGLPVERYDGENTRMMLTGQVFSIMMGTAGKEETAAITKAADKYLYEEKLGGYKLNTNFYEVKKDLGRMFGFAYGHKENGAVFAHMAVMYANALYKRGFGKEGHKVINALYRQAFDFETSRIYPGIPEYFNSKGRGMYHYLTGSASWLTLTVLQEMFGVKGVEGNLTIAPALMLSQFDGDGKASVEMNFGKRQWSIVYSNTQKKEYGEYQVSGALLDGEKIALTDGKCCILKEKIQELSDQSRHELILILE